jgi:tetratricopeptide (TPR) repeat protein
VSPPDSTTTQASVDAQHPWLGLDSFSEETRAYFYGRDEEVAELARRVQRKTLTILFGQSGLGKTSILRAGIVPRLRSDGYCPVYVRIDYSQEAPAPSDQIKGAIYRATRSSGHWTQTGVAVEGESLWEFLHHRDDVLRDERGKTLIPLLIFDQFEEIFTLAQNDDFGRKRAAQFLDDLADLVENRPPVALEEKMDRDDATVERFDFTRSDYRILIALREDYLAHLEGVKGNMPSITQNRMRLARMTGAQALAAVMGPGGNLVNQEVAEAIVRFIAGGSELRNAEVEPSLLSLICRELNNARIAQGRTEISTDVLAGSRETILSEFYERALADQPPGVRKFIEDEMLTESGFRESLAEERVQKAFAAAGASPDALASLVNWRLLRIEERLDLRRVELTHDVLCSVVAASRELRHEREARDEAERKLAQQRERERATRKALVRARQIAAGCAVLAIIAIGGTIFGYISTKRAQEAELKAQQTRVLAESARGEAEKLIVYLLDDFYLELEPVGRLDVVAALAKRAVNYYAGLPPELRTPETDRNRALALVRYGAALRTQSRLDDSQKALTEAIGVLSKLQDNGDKSEATAIGLGLGLTFQARVLDSLNQRAETSDVAQKAVDALKPLMSAPNLSVSLRRAYGAALLYQGYSQLNSDRENEAVRTLEDSRANFRSIDDLKLGDLPSAAGYAEASAWEAVALVGVGKIDQARQVGDEGIHVAGQVLEARPGHMPALRARALLVDTLAGAEMNDLHRAKAQALAEQGERDWEAFVKLDPTNQVAWNNLVGSTQTRAYAMLGLGQIHAAMESLRAGLALEPYVKPSGMIGRTLAVTAGYLAGAEANAGNRKASEATLLTNRRFSEMGVQGVPANSFGRMFSPEFLIWYGFPSTGLAYGAYAPAFAARDYETVRNLARASIKRIEQMKPSDASQELNKKRLAYAAHWTVAEASYNLKDYATADAEIKQALEMRQAIPTQNLFDERDLDNARVLQAMIAARMERYSEAEKTIEPVLKRYRELYARKDNDDRSQHLEFAQALLASGMTAPGEKTAELTQAAAILDGLPPEMRGLVSTSVWRERVAEEQKKHP